MFVGSCSSVFYALDRKSGEVVWRYDIRQDGEQREFHTDAVIRGPAVLIGTDFRDETGIGHVYSFDRETGSVRWKRQTRHGFPSDLAGSKGQTYAVTFAGELLTLDDATGTVRWSFTEAAGRAGFSRPSAPAAAGDSVFFGSADGRIFSLNAGSGKVKWTRALGTPIHTPLALWGQTISFGTEDRRVCRVDARDGALQVCRTFDDAPSGKPVAAGDFLILLLGGSGSCCASIISLDSSLRTRWTQRAPEGSQWDTFRPAVSGDTVLIGSDRGELFAFRVTDGSKIWSQNFGGPIRSIGSAGGILYVGTLNGTVFAFDPRIR